MPGINYECRAWDTWLCPPKKQNKTKVFSLFSLASHCQSKIFLLSLHSYWAQETFWPPGPSHATAQPRTDAVSLVVSTSQSSGSEITSQWSSTASNEFVPLSCSPKPTTSVSKVCTVEFRTLASPPQVIHANDYSRRHVMKITVLISYAYSRCQVLCFHFPYANLVTPSHSLQGSSVISFSQRRKLRSKNLISFPRSCICMWQR